MPGRRWPGFPRSIPRASASWATPTVASGRCSPRACGRSSPVRSGAIRAWSSTRRKGGYVNYWERWYLGYYPPPWEHTWDEQGAVKARGAYPSLRRDGHDLHELHALMAPRPFLVSGGCSDGSERWTALNHAVAVNRLLRIRRACRHDESAAARSRFAVERLGLCLFRVLVAS